MKLYKSLQIAILLISLTPGLLALEYIHTQTIELVSGQSTYQLSNGNIIVNTETVETEVGQLEQGIDYVLDYKSGLLTLLRPQDARFILVRYLNLPSRFAQSASFYEIYTSQDSLPQINARRPLFNPDSNLNLRGSKTFALSFSDDAAFDLKQSLFVNLSGSLAQNVEILAQLSDSQSKLSPEGDSRELSSLDKVFIKVFGPRYEIAMGDLAWKSQDSKYLSYTTSFEGLKAAYQGSFNLEAGYSAATGKTASMVLEIIEGKQGPYYLNVDGFQSSYKVVAGSERIYLDGKLLDRGSDYTIDYNEGTVMFLILVSPANNVLVNYQYSDENYKQSMLYNSFRYDLSPKLYVVQNMIHQTDDSSVPLVGDFSDSDLEALAAAGDNNVWGNGIFEVEPGSGTYKQAFTGDGIPYYVYAAGDSLADYNLFFSYVGYGSGDYEQYSSGKYIYRGQGMGSWLPQKRLIAPVRRTNVNTGLHFHDNAFSLGAEAIYTVNDLNTLSDLDDGDNRSVLYNLNGAWRNDAGFIKPELWIDYEKRLEDSYLFAQVEDPGEQQDMSLIAMPDSLSREQLTARLKLQVGEGWLQTLSFQTRSYPGQTTRSLRYMSINSAKGLIPQTSLNATYALHESDEPNTTDSQLYYSTLNSQWNLSKLSLRLEGLLNALLYDDNQNTLPGTAYWKLNPTLSYSSGNNLRSSASFAADQALVQHDDWQKLNSSSTLAIKQVYNSQANNLDLDYTHREIRKHDAENPRSFYDLARFRSTHNWLKNALNLTAQYQLNQTEFFPRIRELEYVGVGLGLYDSTGVVTSGGDYDYTYITSDQGITSSEITASASAYLRPGLVFSDDISRRFTSDISLSAVEITEQRNELKTYLFFPGYVFDPLQTIYGRQTFLQNLWVDLWRSKVNLNLAWDIDRSLDRRYQELYRSYTQNRSIGLEFRAFLGSNFNLRYISNQEDDSRYESSIDKDNYSFIWQKNYSTQTALDMNLDYSEESGDSYVAETSYTLKSLSLTGNLRTVYQQKYRFSSRLGFRYNDRSGSDYLSFLPEKREGFSTTWNLKAIYRINSFSSVNFDYTGNLYPEQKARHTMKLEFKAEL
ncbi:MAG TPA: hypothetical protein PLX59_00955 [Candidatus Cloacimonadota bacterium]|nr:hypothetical protein [Candidatus Cloacimonadota bacterium]